MNLESLRSKFKLLQTLHEKENIFNSEFKHVQWITHRLKYYMERHRDIIIKSKVISSANKKEQYHHFCIFPEKEETRINFDKLDQVVNAYVKGITLGFPLK